MKKLFWKENYVWYVHPVVVALSSIATGALTVWILIWI